MKQRFLKLFLGLAIALGVGQLTVDSAQAKAHQKTQATQTAPKADQAQADKVWMNTRSMVYHNASCRYYQNTAAGELLTREEAEKMGRPCHKCGG